MPATTRCPLYNMSAIDRFDCVYLLMLFKYRKDKNQKWVINYFSYFMSSCAVRNVVFNIFFFSEMQWTKKQASAYPLFFFPNIFWIICLWLSAGKTRFKNSSKYCNKTRITRITTNNDVDVVLVFLLLTLNMFHTFSYCFYCWLSTSKS